MNSKKIFFTSICALMFFLSQAQIQQGSWAIGGSSTMSFSNTSLDGVNQSNISLSGLAGYFFSDNVAAGARISYRRTGGNGFTNTSFSIGPSIRYYFPESIFLGTSISYTQNRVESDLSNGQTDSGQILFEAGYPILIKEVVGIEPALVYTLDTNSTIDRSAFGLFVGIVLYFGN